MVSGRVLFVLSNLYIPHLYSRKICLTRWVRRASLCLIYIQLRQRLRDILKIDKMSREFGYLFNFKMVCLSYIKYSAEQIALNQLDYSY